MSRPHLLFPLLATFWTPLAIARDANTPDGGTGGSKHLRPDAAPVPASNAPRFAVLPHGVTLFRTPSAVSLGEPEASDCHSSRRSHPAAWVVRVLAEHGEMFEVETLGEVPAPEVHCSAVSDDSLQANALGKYRLRFFVPRSQLLTVTRKEVAVTGADGSLLRLRPGVVVQRMPNVAGTGLYEGEVDERAYSEPAPTEESPHLTPEERGLAFTDGLLGSKGTWNRVRFTVALPSDALGNIYIPADWSEATRTRASQELSYDLMDRKALKVGDVATVTPNHVGWVGRVQWDEGVSVAEFRRHCLIVRAPVATQRLHHSQKREAPRLWSAGGNSLCGSRNRRSPWSVRAGAAVYWADGAKAGEVLAQDHLAGLAWWNSRGHQCFFVPLDGTQAPPVLCFEHKDLQFDEGAMRRPRADALEGEGLRLKPLEVPLLMRRR